MQSTNNTITTNSIHRKLPPNRNSLVLQNLSLNGSFNSVEDLLWDDTLDLLLNLDSKDFYQPNACFSSEFDLLDKVPPSRLHDDRIKATNKIGSYQESGGAEAKSVSTVQKQKLMPMKKKTFPFKLSNILSIFELSPIICWSPHGRAFKVLNPEKLETEVLPKFFKTRKMSSFRKQLSLWGFTRIYSGPDIGCYYHDFFLRGMPQLLNRVKYQKVKGVGKSRRPNPKNGPDFYSKPPLPQIMPKKPSISSGLEEITSFPLVRQVTGMPAMLPLVRQVTGMPPMLPISSEPDQVTSIPRTLPISSGIELVSEDSEHETDLTLLRTTQNFSLRQIFEDDCIVAV